MIKVVRVFFILVIIFVALLVLKGIMDNVGYLREKNRINYFLDNQFSKLKFVDLPRLLLTNSKDDLLVSNGIYISDRQKSTEGIKDWRRIQHWIKKNKDFSYLEVDLISFYSPKDVWIFYKSEEDSKILELPHEIFKQKEEGSFGYYISESKPKKINLEELSPDYPGYASFLLIVKDNLFIEMDESSSSENTDHKLAVLKQITPSQ
ncbi:MAG TPA: hypothetical protein VGB16_00645 [candidate division Zixibacteria bacterium]